MVFWKKEVNAADVLVKDPVCGMKVDPNSAHLTAIGRKIYYFCGAGCKAGFKKAMSKNLDSRPLKSQKPSRGGGGCCH